MMRQFFVVDSEATEVHDPADAGIARGFREDLRGREVALGEVAALAHRMDEIVRDLDPIERRAHLFAFEEVAFENVNAIESPG